MGYYSACEQKTWVLKLCVMCCGLNVLSWTGLPLSILGDGDTRLRAKEMRAVTNYLGVRLSAAYHPHTDGKTGEFQPYHHHGATSERE